MKNNHMTFLPLPTSFNALAFLEGIKLQKEMTALQCARKAQEAEPSPFVMVAGLLVVGLQMKFVENCEPALA